MLGDFYKEYFNDGITLKEEKKEDFLYNIIKIKLYILKMNMMINT